MFFGSFIPCNKLLTAFPFPSMLRKKIPLIHPDKLWEGEFLHSWFSNMEICINQDFIFSVFHFLQVLKTIRKEVLKGCKIVFSRVFPTKFPADNHHLWRMAENLGATCSTELDSSVTHVVSTDAATEKSRWAVKQNKFLVHTQWLEAANYLWQKQPEENFPVNQTKSE